MAFLANWVKVKNEKFAQKSKNPLSFENERGLLFIIILYAY